MKGLNKRRTRENKEGWIHFKSLFFLSSQEQNEICHLLSEAIDKEKKKKKPNIIHENFLMVTKAHILNGGEPI